MINYAELILHSNNGEQASIDLSPTQLSGIIKLLGLSYDKKTNSYIMLSDDSLKNFMEKTINRWEMK